MTTFFTSDLHFGHRLVAGLRGFGEIGMYMDVQDGFPVEMRETKVSDEDVREHDEAIIRNWNSVVAPQDEVWVLGDLTLRAPDQAWSRVDRLHGWKRLVWGNHDAGFAGNRGHQKHQRDYLEHFESVHDYASVRLEGQQVMLSHFPYTGDRGADRAKPFRLRDEGLMILHGHTHSREQLTWSDGGTLQIHVGLDAHKLKPASEAWVMRMIRETVVAA